MMISERKSSFIRQLLWAATLAIGFGTVWSLVAVWLLAAIDSARAGAKGSAWEQLVVRSDGTPLIRSTSVDDLSLSIYRDLAGREQEAPEANDLLPGISVAGEHERPGFFADQPGWDVRLNLFVNEQEPTALWYFVHDGKPEGAGYFVGYERKSNRRIGFIGLSGFRSGPAPIDEWIPVRSALMMGYSQWSSAPISIAWGQRWERLGFRPDRWDLPPRLVHVPSGNRLQLVDLAARTIKTVFESPEPIESLGVPVISSHAQGRPAKEQPILVRSGDQIRTLNHNYQATRIFTIPTEADRRSTLTWYEIGDGQAIAEFQRPGTARRASQIIPRMMYRIAGDGTIRDRFEVVLQNGPPGLTQQMGTLLLSLAVPVPAIVIATEPLFLMGIDPAQSYPAALLAMIKNSWSSLLVVFALAFVLAVLAKRRGRAFGLSEREQYSWAVFVFLFGIPAYLGFVLYRHWPVRLPCPNCQVRAPRDRAACAECGTRFPEPSLKGIEIFA
jgi:hypothetical protein